MSARCYTRAGSATNGGASPTAVRCRFDAKRCASLNLVNMQSMRHWHFRVAVAPVVLGLVSVLLLSAGCNGGAEKADERGAGTVDVVIPPDVPFDPAQWTTTADYAPFGDQSAKRELQD